jgi:hypothetical protein
VPRRVHQRICRECRSTPIKSIVSGNTAEARDSGQEPGDTPVQVSGGHHMSTSRPVVVHPEQEVPAQTLGTERGHLLDRDRLGELNPERH